MGIGMGMGMRMPSRKWPTSVFSYVDLDFTDYSDISRNRVEEQQQQQHK